MNQGIGKASGSEVLTTRYKNTIDLLDQPEYPGNIEIEKKIEDIIRWNTVIMVNRANSFDGSLGGILVLRCLVVRYMKVDLITFFMQELKDHGGDVILIQGHTVEQTYARSYLEGIFNRDHLNNF